MAGDDQACQREKGAPSAGEPSPLMMLLIDQLAPEHRSSMHRTEQPGRARTSGKMRARSSRLKQAMHPRRPPRNSMHRPWEPSMQGMSEDYTACIEHWCMVDISCTMLHEGSRRRHGPYSQHEAERAATPQACYSTSTGMSTMLSWLTVVIAV